jgi:prepilin-type processing-associated H-X9-DG protein
MSHQISNDSNIPHSPPLTSGSVITHYTARPHNSQANLVFADKVKVTESGIKGLRWVAEKELDG